MVEKANKKNEVLKEKLTILEEMKEEFKLSSEKALMEDGEDSLSISDELKIADFPNYPRLFKCKTYPQLFKCKTCEDEFDSTINLMKHIEMFHEGRKEQSQSKYSQLQNEMQEQKLKLMSSLFTLKGYENLERNRCN